jgi:peptidoglycan/LPS O-acetylase OafA/YrhL
VFLDGVRGLAALYVVFFHVWQATTYRTQPTTPVRIALGWTCTGLLGVTVFIVLSGFLLNLPVARTGALPGGLWGFAKRRGRRILPAYYAALSLSAVFVLGIVPGLFNDPDAHAYQYMPDAPWEEFAAHAVLVHNLRSDWLYGINGPLWSVATEWQIYVVFALLLVPARARFGPTAAMALGMGLAVVAVAAAMVPELCVPPLACLWLVGSFALGGFAAEVAEGRYRHWLDRWPWAMVAGLSAVGLIAWVEYVAAGNKPSVRSVFVACGSASVGTAAMILMILRGGRWPDRLARVLTSRWAAGLGAFSYSLYLTHGPLVAAGDAYLMQAGVSGPERTAVMALVGVPACVSFAYLFYLLFERPTLARRNRPAPDPKADEAPLHPAQDADRLGQVRVEHVLLQAKAEAAPPQVV